jgi:hypothetical protein
MNRFEDSDLREALRRRETRRQKPEVPADFMDSVMQQIETKPTVGRRWRWMAAAASLLILIGIGTLLMDEPKQDEPTLAKTELPPVPKVSEALPEPIETNVEEKPKIRQKRKTVVKPRTPRPEIPDTLGSGIWQSERNVRLAIKMLSECEAVIEKSEQEVRNNIVRATFNAMPQPANAVLVTNEAGDCFVSDTNRETIIEI